MTKTIITLLLLISVISITEGQNVVKKLTFYDWKETKIKREWHELGNGKAHGIEKFYDKNGKLRYSIKYTNGIRREEKTYSQTGDVFLEVYKNEKGEHHGIQKIHRYDSRSNLFLQAKANVVNGSVKEYYWYNSDGSCKWSFVNNDGIKTYNEYENNVLVKDFSFSNGKMSGFKKPSKLRSESFDINENKIIALETYEVSVKNINDNLKFYNKKTGWETNRVLTEPKSIGVDEEFVTGHPAVSVMFSLDIRIHDNISPNYTKTGKTILSSEGDTFNDVTKLIAYFSHQYKPDGMAYIKKNGKVTNASEWDNGKQLWYAGYNSNEEMEWKTTEMYNTVFMGKKYDYLYKNEFFKDGKIVEEVIGDKSYEYSTAKFDSNGNIIGGTKLKLLFQEAEKEYASIAETYHQYNNKVNAIIKDEFGIDTKEGQFIKTLYIGKNKNIFEAFRIVHLDYIKTWKASYSDYKKRLAAKKVDETKINWTSNDDYRIKMIVYQEQMKLFKSDLKDLQDFFETIEIFQKALNSSNLSDINKSLKKVHDSKTIMEIISKV